MRDHVENRELIAGGLTAGMLGGRASPRADDANVYVNSIVENHSRIIGAGDIIRTQDRTVSSQG